MHNCPNQSGEYTHDMINAINNNKEIMPETKGLDCLSQ
jgi:hypothetical protein